MRPRGRHVSPHRLVAVESGEASVRERARALRHVSSCPRCASARERLVRARAAMADIAAQQAPELGWDHIGVRVYWSTSSARHAALREKERAWWRRPPMIAAATTLAVAAAVGAALTMWPSGDRGVPGDRAPVRAAAPAPVRAAAPAPAALVPLRGVVTFASGAVAVDGATPRREVDLAALFASAIVEGSRLRTGDGRLVVQFGQASGFALPPRSAVTVRRFDDRAVELVVEEGAVEVEVSRRRMDQTFSVVAGRHRVSVLGTAFQVGHRAGDLDVACARGRVVVSDGASQVALAAGEQLKVLERSLLGRALPEGIAGHRLAALERSLARPLLPAWIDSPALFDTSSTVQLAAPTGRTVRVDGVEVGAGSFALRVMSGRHHLEVADSSGGFGHGAWIDAEPRARQEARAGGDGVVLLLPSGAAGADRAARAGDPLSPENAARAARRLRRRQLDRALDGSARARECMTPLEKRDLVSGSSVQFDIGINADGSQGHLNVVRSNVPPDVERCLRGVVDGVELPAGPRATLRFKLAF
jgi:hypothetical protein